LLIRFCSIICCIIIVIIYYIIVVSMYICICIYYITLIRCRFSLYGINISKSIHPLHLAPRRGYSKPAECHFGRTRAERPRPLRGIPFRKDAEGSDRAPDASARHRGTIATTLSIDAKGRTSTSAGGDTPSTKPGSARTHKFLCVGRIAPYCVYRECFSVVRSILKAHVCFLIFLCFFITSV